MRNAVDVLSLCADVGACGVATHPWSVISLAFKQSALHNHFAHGRVPELVRVRRDRCAVTAAATLVSGPIARIVGLPGESLCMAAEMIASATTA